MFSDVSKSIKATLYERVTSPLFGSFSISWIIWNYKTILVLISSLKVKEKISFIESSYPDILSLSLQGFIFPLISAVLFILIYPYPAKWIYRYWSKRQKELKDIKQEIDDTSLLTLKESREIRRELVKLESEYESEIEKTKLEINNLKSVILNLEEKNSTSKSINTSEVISNEISMINNDNVSSNIGENEIYVGHPNNEDVDKLSVHGYKKVGMVDGPTGTYSIFSKQPDHVKKFNSLIDSEEKKESFYNLVRKYVGEYGANDGVQKLLDELLTA